MILYCLKMIYLKIQNKIIQGFIHNRLTNITKSQSSNYLK
jgi:hypothetical protein